MKRSRSVLVDRRGKRRKRTKTSVRAVDESTQREPSVQQRPSPTAMRIPIAGEKKTNLYRPSGHPNTSSIRSRRQGSDEEIAKAINESMRTAEIEAQNRAFEDALAKDRERGKAKAEEEVRSLRILTRNNESPEARRARMLIGREHLTTIRHKSK